MRIHLADASPERGQYALLSKELFCSSLFSYAYRTSKNTIFAFEWYWNELVKIHLATTCHEKISDGRLVRVLLPEEKHESSLMSYAYEKETQEEWAESWNHAMKIHLAIAGTGSASTLGKGSLMAESQAESLFSYAEHKAFRRFEDYYLQTDLRPRVIIDSGAFTAWSTGKTIRPQDYAAWALDFDQRWRHKMATLEFMNLDVIGDQDATWVNQGILEGLGMNPLPIVTFGVDLAHLDRALEDYDYIALGGLVPYTRDKAKLKSWLDACFSKVMKYRKRTGTFRRIHLLGITTDWVLKRYPCYSSDSSSWVSCLRFGGGAAAGIKQLPRYKESDAAMAATIHTLRSEIRKYKKMQDDTTKLWKTRGIVFDD